VLSAKVNLLTGSAALATQSVTTTAIPYTLKHTGTGTITLSGTSTAGPLVGPGTLTFTPTAGTLTLTVTGSVTVAQLETGSTATRYQRITTATDYDTVGFKTYLKFDSVDDSLSTGSIDFTSTDKMSVFAGVRKLSDAAVGLVVELSSDLNTNNGSFYVGAPANNGTANTGFSVKGTIAAGASASSFASPISAVVTGTAAISSPLIIQRRNGVQVSSSSAALGTGNFGNYNLYVGSRGGTTLPFNGHLYSLIIRGAASSASQIASAESYVNSKTGAY
jgi:hypothetical protein